MPKSLATLLFLVVEIFMLPLTIVGVIIFSTIFFSRIRSENISKAAYQPIFSRWFMHELGIRENLLARQLWYALPGVSRLGTRMAFGPTVFAMRITGMALHWYDFSSSASFMDSFGQRTRFFDEALLQYLNQIEQVVILGAGWDTRACDLARQTDLRVYEVDEGSTQTQKRQSLEKANIDTSQVIFISTDLNTESFLDALAEYEFNPAKPAFVLMEGVTYYLEPEAVKAIFQTVGKGFAKGSTIAFDYAGKHIIDGDALGYHRFIVPMSGLFGEGWKFGISTIAPAEEQLTTFLVQNGLTLIEYEPIGKVDKQQKLDGGLALAVNY